LTKIDYVYKNEHEMKKLSIILIFLLFNLLPKLYSQEKPDTEVYLITCNPGVETYSHYGHSALRVIIPESKIDLVYNWGVFDFSTPNFAWKFAKGRLDYKLVAYTFQQFLTDYFFEKRSVFQQKINLEPAELKTLLFLINENLRPENVRYRYDFFYDDCSTRIRDLLEKSMGEKFIYPPSETRKLPSFRDKVGEYQKHYPWLDLGIDIIMGISADKKATLRDQMFLPFDLKRGLSEILINRENKMIPLLQNAESVFEFDLPEYTDRIYFSPLMVLSFILILTIIFSAMFKGVMINKLIDIILFTGFSILAILMIFFNFFTDHQQMKWNFNIIWLNPLLVLCLFSIVFNRNCQICFRLVFYSALIFLIPLIFLPYIFNNGLIPLAMIIILRSSARAGFSWNPFAIN
jgi:hypothetical protein